MITRRTSAIRSAARTRLTPVAATRSSRGFSRCSSFWIKPRRGPRSPGPGPRRRASLRWAPITPASPSRNISSGTCRPPGFLWWTWARIRRKRAITPSSAMPWPSRSPPGRAPLGCWSARRELASASPPTRFPGRAPRWSSMKQWPRSAASTTTPTSSASEQEPPRPIWPLKSSTSFCPPRLRGAVTRVVLIKWKRTKPLPPRCV